MSNQTNAQGADWRATLPQEWTVTVRGEDGKEREVPLGEHPFLGKYASKDEAIKALVHAQKFIGRRPDGYVRVPGPASPDEEWQELFAALGRPEGADGYELPEFELPEDIEINEDLRDRFREKAHELGLMPGQVQGLYEWFLPLTVAAAEDMRDNAVRRRASEMDALRSVHRGDTANVLEGAKQAAQALGGEELVRVLEETGAGDHATVIDALARVAPLILEGRFRSRNSGPALGLSREKLKEMVRDPRYWDPSQRDADFVEQVNRGFQNLHPGNEEAETNQRN